MIRRLLLLLLFTAFAGSAAADHLVGSDWQMSALGNGRFLVRLTLYTDAASGSPNAFGDPTVTIAAYERGTGGSSDRFVEAFNMTRTTSAVLAGGAPGCAFASQPIRAIGYESTLTLVPSQYSSSSGYYLTWERCCRNRLVTNLRSPESTGLVATVQFPAVAAANQVPNSAPQFVAAPPSTALCLSALSELNLSATDADGDSLAYTLVAPLAGNTSQSAPIINIPNPGPYVPVRYAPGFSALQPLAGTVAMDARTGALRITATQPGTYAVAVQVSEYRARRKIGENRRDLELTVVACPANAPPTLTRATPTPPDTVVITGAADRCFTILAADADAGQTLTVRVLGNAPVSLNPATFTVPSPAAPQVVDVCWLDCGQPGRQTLTLIVSDDGCRASTPDTLRIPVRIVPTANLAPTINLLSTAPLTATAGQELSFEVEFSDPDAGPSDVLTPALSVSGSAVLSASLRADPPSGPSPFRTTIRWTPPCVAARVGQETPYRIRLQISDAGCRPLTDTASVVVRVLPGGATGTVLLPNIITPMQERPDGLNDCFGLPAGVAAGPDEPCGDVFQSVRIFNRWGREVFFSADSAFCWDAPGLSAGTYFYLLQWATHRQRGLLTVIR